MMEIDSKTIDLYGKRSSYKPFNLQQTTYDKKPYMIELSKIYNNQYKEVNKLLLDKYMISAMHENSSVVTELLVELMTEKTQKILLELDDQKNYATNFLKLHKTFMIQSKIIKNSMYKFDKTMNLVNSNKKYSYILLIASLVFYREVISQKQNEKYVWELLLNDTDINIFQFNKLFKIFNFYKALEKINGQIIKDNYIEQCNPVSHVAQIVDMINEKIINLKDHPDNSLDKQLFSIRDLIKVGSHFKNFNDIYELFLLKRIIDPNNKIIELEFLKSFKCDTNSLKKKIENITF